MIYQTALHDKLLLLDSGKGMGITGKLVSFSINVKPMDEQIYLEFVWPSIVMKGSGYIAAIKSIDLKQNLCNQGKGYCVFIFSHKTKYIL